MKRSKLFMGLVAGALIFNACGPAEADPDAIEKAWTLYEEGNVSEAKIIFAEQSAIGNAEAFVGLGWCAIDENQAATAHTYFQNVSGDSLSDAYAGWCAVSWSLEDYPSAIMYAQFVLRHDNAYTFSHKSSVTHSDLIWYQASSYLHASNYSQCYAKIRELEPNYTTDINAVNIADVLSDKLESLSADVMARRWIN